MKARSSDGERRGPLFTLVDIAGEDDIDALDLGANPTPPTVSRTSIGDLAAEGLKDDGWRYESAADSQLLLPNPIGLQEEIGRDLPTCIDLLNHL